MRPLLATIVLFVLAGLLLNNQDTIASLFGESEIDQVTKEFNELTFRQYRYVNTQSQSELDEMQERYQDYVQLKDKLERLNTQTGSVETHQMLQVVNREITSLDKSMFYLKGLMDIGAKEKFGF